MSTTAVGAVTLVGLAGADRLGLLPAVSLRIYNWTHKTKVSLPPVEWSKVTSWGVAYGVFAFVVLTGSESKKYGEVWAALAVVTAVGALTVQLPSMLTHLGVKYSTTGAK